ncbi:TRAP transporter substrate-binding protein [Shimia biformata]|uniref:TRAP transporter substrate-binding protein n=1 Tax=Shimia biformata TaxID=1294299 RepID=UPI001950F490|nr:TRAP transporter substrate-binding protein [Shimia biformata]
MKHWIKTTAAGLALGAMMSTAATTLQAREMNVATYLPAASGFVKDLLVPWADWVNERSGDDFSLRVFAGGTLSRDPNQQDKIVRDGIADIAVIIPSRNPSEYPQFSVFGLPGLARSGVLGSAAAWSMYKDGSLPDVSTVKILALWVSDPYIVHSSSPVTSLEDLKGKKFRAIGATQTDTILALGGVPENVKITETPESIMRGILDGALADWAVASTFKITEVTDHSYDVPLGTLPFFLGMNKNSYDELSDESKALLAEAGEKWQEMLATFYNEQNETIIAAANEAGTTIVQASDADIEQLVAKTQGVYADVAERAGADVIDAYRAALAASSN